MSLLLIITIFSLSQAYADGYTKCSKHYFKNGKVATSECYDADNRWGKARAYNLKGEVIYEKDLRRVAGHSSVQFDYYPSGAVKKASWSSAPDGGIQWYRSHTEFSEDGKVLSDINDSYDDSPGTSLKRLKTEERPATRDTSRTIACAEIYASEYWFENKTPYMVKVSSERGAEHVDMELKPGTTVKGGQMIQAQQFDEPTKFYKFTAGPTKKHKQTRLIIIPAERKPEKASHSVMRYYYEVRRIL